MGGMLIDTFGPQQQAMNSLIQMSLWLQQQKRQQEWDRARIAEEESQRQMREAQMQDMQERRARQQQEDLHRQALEQNPQLLPGWDTQGPTLDEVQRITSEPNNLLPAPQIAPVQVPSAVPGGKDYTVKPVPRWAQEMQERFEQEKALKATREQSLAKNPLKEGEIYEAIPGVLEEVKGPAKAKSFEERVYNERIAAGWTAERAYKFATGKQATEASLAEAAAAGDPLAEKALKKMVSTRSASRAPGIDTDGASEGLTDETKNMAARYYLKTGQLPPMGTGKHAVKDRRDILNRASMIDSGADIAINKADFSSNEASLKKLTTLKDQVLSFEKTANRNLDLFIDAAGRVPDTLIPWMNRPVRALNEKVIGSEAMAAMNALRQTAVTEVAKVNSGATSGVVSDSNRHEINALLDPNATLQQWIAAAKALKADMRNREVGFDEQIKEIRGRIGGGQGSAGQSAATGAQQQPQTWEELKRKRGW